MGKREVLISDSVESLVNTEGFDRYRFPRRSHTSVPIF